MKALKIYFFALLTVASIVSCKKAGRTELTVEDFRNETRLHVIAEKVNLFSAISSTENKRVLEEYGTLRENLDYIIGKYGKQKAKIFALQLLKKAKAESTEGRAAQAPCCALNLNGTTDQSCCNFWERIVVAIETLDCSHPYPGAPQSVIQEFYQCIQAEVCENC